MQDFSQGYHWNQHHDVREDCGTKLIGHTNQVAVMKILASPRSFVTWLVAIFYSICAIWLLDLEIVSGEDHDFPEKTRLGLFEHVNTIPLHIVIAMLIFLITAAFMIGYSVLGKIFKFLQENLPESM